MFAIGLSEALNAAAVAVAAAIFFYGWKRNRQMQRDLADLEQSLSEGLAALNGLQGPVDFYKAFDRVRAALALPAVVGPHWKTFARNLVRDPLNETFASPTPAADHFGYDLLYGPELHLRKHEAIPNQLVGIGLLGTFVGLMISLAIASGGLSGDVENAKRSLIALMSASAIKFITSIAAIFSALVFTHTKNAKLSAIHRQIDYFAHRLDALVVPISSERLASESNAELAKQTEFLASRNQELATAIAEALDERLKTSLKDAIAPVATEIGTMGEKMGEISEATMRYMIEMFSKELGGAAREHSERMADLLNEVSRAVERVPERIDESSAALSASLERSARGVEDTFGKSGKALSSVLSGAAVSIERNSKGWAAAGDKMERLILAIEHSGEKFSERLTAVNEMTDQSVERLRAHADALRVAAENMPALDEAARQLQEASAMLERSVQGIAKLETINEDAQRRSQEAGDHFLQTVSSIEAEMKALDNSMAAVFAKTGSGLAMFKDQTSEIVTSMDSQLATAVGRLADVVRDFKKEKTAHRAAK